MSTHPALRVNGEVPDKQALRDLNALVAAPSDANYKVMVSVKIVESSATRPAR